MLPAPVIDGLEQFQEKCEAVFRSKLHQNKERDRVRDSRKREHDPDDILREAAGHSLAHYSLKRSGRKARLDGDDLEFLVAFRRDDHRPVETRKNGCIVEFADLAFECQGVLRHTGLRVDDGDAA